MFPLVGMRHHPPAVSLMNLLGNGTPLTLFREPTNQYDANAILVRVHPGNVLNSEELAQVIQAETQEGREVPDLNQDVVLGYIKATSAKDLAPKIDAMIAGGEIANAADIPCFLTYQDDGQPSVQIKTGEEEVPQEVNLESENEVEQSDPEASTASSD